MSHLCNIWRYSAGHSWIIVETWTDGKPAYYLGFEAVLYFAGEVNWLGANFQVAPSSHCKGLLATLRSWEEGQLENVLNHVLLFTVSLPTSQIKIIASNIYVSTEMPLELGGLS